MKPMSKKVVFGASVSLALTLALTVDESHRAFSATQLDGFAINTHDKAVTVTLYTDQHATYTTETIGRQFTIILSDAQLSKRQSEEGLPVVIDDKNRFIGRAVPTSDGKVKIILPNLPANEYDVSIQQQQASSAVSKVAAENTSASGRVASSKSAATSKPVALAPVKPRPAVKLNTASQFEKVTAPHAEPVSNPRFSVSKVANNRLPIDISSDGSSEISRHTIWNPYVVQRTADITTGSPHPMRLATGSPTAIDFTAGAVSEALPPDWNALAAAQARAEQLKNDPLGYLHAVPPMAFNAIPPQFPVLTASGSHIGMIAVKEPTDGGKPADGKPVDPKAGSVVAVTTTKSVQATTTPQAQTVPGSLASSLPHWLWVSLALFLALFLGGIGLFCLIGALSLLRLVFLREKSVKAATTPSVGPAVAMPVNAVTFPNFQAQLQSVISPLAGFSKMPASTATKPSTVRPAGTFTGNARTMQFADTAVVNALDYTTRAPRSMTDAVESGLTLRFSSRHAQQTRPEIIA
jgi:hypothetical protein